MLTLKPHYWGNDGPSGIGHEARLCGDGFNPHYGTSERRPDDLGDGGFDDGDGSGNGGVWNFYPPIEFEHIVFNSLLTITYKGI